MTRETERDGDQEVASPKAWGRIAAGYGEFVAPGEASFAAVALDLVGLKRHESFLDVAAGTGGLSLPAARLGATVHSNPIAGSILQEVTTADQTSVRDALDQTIKERARGRDAAVLTSKLNIGWGWKPPSR